MSRSPRGAETGTRELAQLLLALGRPDEALRAAEEAWARNPSLPGVRDLLAMLRASGGRVHEAEQLYTDALAARPRDAAARAGLGRFHLAIGDARRAVQQLTLAARDEPTDPGICRDLAVALVASGRPDDAIATLDRGIDRCPPARAELLHAGANLLAQIGRHAEAQQWLHAADAGSPRR
jgi:tetratricopeptide (TPR) repeat protein